MPDEPVTEVLVLRDLGRPLAGEFLEVAALSPSASHRGQPFAPLLLRWRPRIVGVADPFDRWIEEDDTGAAVGIGGSEKHADSRAISPGPKDSRLGVDGVHHRSNVVHHDLGRVDLTHTVRQTCAPLIEHDHSTESCKPLNMANEQRLIPRGQHIPGDTPNENEVRPTIAYHLIRDRHVTASGVVNLAPHDGSLAELKRGRRATVWTATVALPPRRAQRLSTVRAVFTPEPDGAGAHRVSRRERSGRWRPTSECLRGLLVPRRR